MTMVAFSSNGVVAALLGAMVFSGAGVGGADAADSLKMAPRHGVSFDVGSQRAVSYYLGEGGICNLTVLMSDRLPEGDVRGAATRLTTPVIPSRAVRIDTAEGQTLEFKCAPSASAMSVKVLDRVAGFTPRG